MGSSSAVDTMFLAIATFSEKLPYQTGLKYITPPLHTSEVCLLDKLPLGLDNMTYSCEDFILQKKKEENNRNRCKGQL